MVVRDKLEQVRRPRGWRASLTATALAGALALGMAAAVPAAPAAADPLPGVTAHGNGNTMAPVDLAHAGEFVGWGRSAEGQTQLPAELQGVALRKVVAGSTVTLALTADGRVVAWGYDAARLQAVPADVQSLDVVDIAIGGGYAGVVTRTGEVRIWGQSSELYDTPLDVPAGLSGVKQLVFPVPATALALLDDGTVIGWGTDHGNTGLLNPPVGLKAVAITAEGVYAYALTEDHTVVGWGVAEGQALPEETQQPGNVVAVGTAGGPGDSGRGMALLVDGSVVHWGYQATGLPPTGLPAVVEDDVVAFAVGAGTGSLQLTLDGIFHPGGSAASGNPPDLTVVTPPAQAQGRAVAQFSVGGSHVAMIVTKMLRAAAPTVTGTATVGSTLTGTSGTFSAAPDQVTSEWLADGQPIAGAEGSTLPLTAALVGKQISYRSTATKTGEDTISSTSTATAAVAVPAPPAPPAPAKVGSTTAVGKVTVAKGAKKVVVTGRVSAAGSPVGQVQVTIAKGTKTIVVRAVPVAVDGSIALTVKKFGKLAAKKTKKGYRGTYRVTLAYLGNAGVTASSAAATFKVKR